MVLGRLAGVMRRMRRVPVRHVRVMPGLLVVAGLVMLGGFAMMVRRGLVVLGGVVVMIGTLVSHDRTSRMYSARGPTMEHAHNAAVTLFVSSYDSRNLENALASKA